MEYRIGSMDLLSTLSIWDELIPGRGRIHLIACGGTALTLLGYKDSTKDVDLLAPVAKEYERLVRFLKAAGYESTSTYGWKRGDEVMVYDLYPGKKVYTTELLNSPLEAGGNQKIREWKKIYLGVLNSIDFVITKLFRGSEADFQDCLDLFRHEAIDLEALKRRLKKTASFDVSEERVLKNYGLFLNRLKEGKRK